MDIIVRSVLEFIQKTKSNAILAGGAVRDQQLGLVPKDYDIFFSGNTKQAYDLMYSVGQEFPVTDVTEKTREYEESIMMPRMKFVYGFKLEGKDFDLIAVDEPDDEDFPESIIRSFDFGINMTYDTGTFIETQNEYFRYDMDFAHISLINLKSIGHLPKAMEKFNRLDQKFGGGWSFRAPSLSLRQEDRGDIFYTPKPHNPFNLGAFNQALDRAQEAEVNWGQIVLAEQARHPEPEPVRWIDGGVPQRANQDRNWPQWNVGNVNNGAGNVNQIHAFPNRAQQAERVFDAVDGAGVERTQGIARITVQDIIDADIDDEQF